MSLEGRIAALETRLAAVEAASQRRTGSLVLREGVDGTAEEIRQRAAEEIAAHGRGPLIILFCDDKPGDPPPPPGVTRFDLQAADL